ERHPPVWFKGPKLVRVTRVGAEMADVGLGPAPIAPNTTIMRHSLGVVDLTEDLLREFPDAELVTERELRRDQVAGKGVRIDEAASFAFRMRCCSSPTRARSRWNSIFRAR